MSELIQPIVGIAQPGDTLIVSTRGPVTAEQAAMLRQQILAELPDLADVVVLDGVTAQAIYRPDTKAQP